MCIKDTKSTKAAKTKKKTKAAVLLMLSLGGKHHMKVNTGEIMSAINYDKVSNLSFGACLILCLDVLFQLIM